MAHELDGDRFDLVRWGVCIGVAFEQGRILPTPETIPFRLTRDIVDGFGPSGVEGTFRKCCESTMRVLREGKDDIMTILEVLAHDPLYTWSMTPAKAYRMQHGGQYKGKSRRNESSEGNGQKKKNNKLAERVLLRVGGKLDGIEEGLLVK